MKGGVKTLKYGVRSVAIVLICLLSAMFILIRSKEPAPDYPASSRVILEQLGAVMESFRRYCGRYPTTDEGFEALKTKPKQLNCQYYPDNGFAARIPMDPWDRSFRYRSDGKSFHIEDSHGTAFDSEKSR
jgi:hypothetical protein